MGGLHPNRLKPADKRGDPVIEDALKRGYMDTGEVYEIPGFPDHVTADEGRKSLYRAARRANISLACWVADDTGEQCWQRGKRLEDFCYDPNGVHRVHFRIWSKNGARAHVLQQSGGDPRNLKFNPWDRPKATRVRDDGTVI